MGGKQRGINAATQSSSRRLRELACAGRARTSISLRRPGDYAPTEGARFSVHIEKGRGNHGADARPFEARLAIADGRTAWSMKEIEDVERTRIATLLDLGFSIRNIAEETGPTGLQAEFTVAA